MKAWKIAIVVAVAIIIVLGTFLVSASAPLSINVNTVPFIIPGDQQQYYQWIITGHMPGQSFKLFYFSISDYISGNFAHGYGGATNSGSIKTDIFGNFQIDYPHTRTSIPANYSMIVKLVSEDGIVIEKTINIRAD